MHRGFDRFDALFASAANPTQVLIHVALFILGPESSENDARNFYERHFPKMYGSRAPGYVITSAKACREVLKSFEQALQDVYSCQIVTEAGHFYT